MTRAGKALGVTVAVAALLVYLRTMAPGLTWAHDGADGGDLAAAIITGGIPHPPGYPTYVLLGRLFAAIPVADVAWRLNLFSVVCAAVTVLLVYALACRVMSSSPSQGEGRDEGAAHIAAAIAALCFAVSPVFWSQALITEVYALHALMVAALLYAAARGYAGRPLFWLLFGLGLGNHLTLLLLLPALWLLARQTSAQQRRSPAHPYGTKSNRSLDLGVLVVQSSTASRLLALLLGLCVYLCLPLRAAAEPAVNWGDPQTLDRFLWMVSAAPYRAYTFALPPAELPARLAAWAGLLVQQFTWPGIALALLGLWDLLCRPDRRWALSTLCIVGLYSIYALWYHTADSYVYMIPAYAAVALWLGCGALLVMEAARSRARKLQLLAAAVLLALPLYQAQTNWPRLDLSDDDAARTFVHAVFNDLPRDALIITTSDERTFALWYAQAAAGRDDVLVVDRDLTQFDWYRHQIEQKAPGATWREGDDAVSSYTAELARRASEQRPVYLADRDAGLPNTWHWREDGVLWRLAVVQ